MTRYDEDWVAALAAPVSGDGSIEDATSVVWIITDTDEGKVAFNLYIDGTTVVQAGAGKLPRGVKPTITITVKESVATELWSGDRNRDAAFMAGDIKVEGAYELWLDDLVPTFATDPWSATWKAATP